MILNYIAMWWSLSLGVMSAPKEKVPPATAVAHTFMAMQAANERVPAELLLAIAYKESRFRRKVRPQCGVTQIATRSRARCRALADSPQLAYLAAVEHLEAWLVTCRRMGRPGMPCAITGYSEGTEAARTRRSAYGMRTLQLARRIRGTLP
jgi:hypothetical protein